MAITLTGTAGCQYQITTTDTDNATGTKVVLDQTDSGVRSLTFTNASKSIAWTGSVGTSGTTIDLYAIADATDATYTMRVSNSISGIVLTEVICLVIHNKSAGDITVEPGASNSFLTASEQITIPAAGCVMLSYATVKTVSATIRNFKLTGASTDYDCEIYVLGNE